MTFRRDQDLEQKLLARIREGEFDRRFEQAPTAEELVARFDELGQKTAPRLELVVDNDAIANACTNCGNVGWTIERNDEEEYMAGCHECWATALDAEQEGAS